jgi:hypothetical protein
MKGQKSYARTEVQPFSLTIFAAFLQLYYSVLVQLTTVVDRSLAG